METAEILKVKEIPIRVKHSLAAKSFIDNSNCTLARAAKDLFGQEVHEDVLKVTLKDVTVIYHREYDLNHYLEDKQISLALKDKPEKIIRRVKILND